jgi:toxin HigB-1
MGIVNCKHKGLEDLFVKGTSNRIGERYHKNAVFILDFLHAITDIKECLGVKDFHALKGKRKDTYSMHVTGNYCITFKWDGENVYDLNFEDYH